MALLYGSQVSGLRPVHVYFMEVTMRRIISYVAIVVVLLFGAPGALAINEHIVCSYTINETGAVNHTWSVEGDPPHHQAVNFGVIPEGGVWYDTNGAKYHQDNNVFGEWSNITVEAFDQFWNPVCNGECDVFVETPYTPNPIPFSMWVALLGFGIVISIIACAHVKNVVIAAPLGAIGTISFLFGGHAVTTNGIEFYSGGISINVITDALVSQIVMLFGIFPLLVTLMSVIGAVFVAFEDKKERQLSEFDDQWG